MAEITLVVEDIFPALDFVSQPVASSFATQTFTVSQSVTCVSTNQSKSQSLNLVQSVSLNKRLNESLTHFLPISSEGRRVKEHSVSNLFSISSNAYRTLPQSVANELFFSQTVSNVRGCTNALALEQTLVLNISKIQSLSQTLNLGNYTVALIDGNWQFTGVYTPVDVLSYDPSQLQTPPVANHKVQLISDTEVLEYDIVDYGDQDTIEHTRISRRTRNEELIIFRDPVWPKTETLKFKLTDLSDTQGKQTLAFLAKNLAATVRLTDWIGVRWSGVIVNPETQLVQSIRDQECGSGRYDIEIEFQGEQLAGYIKELSVVHLLALSQHTAFRTDEASNTFVISQAVSVNTVFSKNTSNTLTFNQIVVRTVFETLNQTLSLSQSVVDNEIFNRSVSSTFTINQLTGSTYGRSVSNTLTINQSVVNTYERSVSNTLTINQSAVNTYDQSVSNTFTINQSAVNTYERSLISTLTFSQTATVIQVFNLLLEDGTYLLLEDNTNTLEEV